MQQVLDKNQSKYVSGVEKLNFGEVSKKTPNLSAHVCKVYNESIAEDPHECAELACKSPK